VSGRTRRRLSCHVPHGNASRHRRIATRLCFISSIEVESAILSSCPAHAGHPRLRGSYPKDVDGRNKSGHDGISAEPLRPLEFDPGFPTNVGGRHMSGPTSPVRDSSLKDR
jgi:hypothetical protein